MFRKLRKSVEFYDLENKIIILFGVGVYSKMVREYIESIGLSVSYYSDNNKEKHGKYIDGIEVLSPQQLKNIENKIVFITARHHVKQVNKQLYDMGIESVSFDRFIVNSRMKDFEYVYENILDDEKSKKVYEAVINAMITGDSKYFDEVMEDNEFYALSNFMNEGNDIFVDAGAYVGDTVERFIWKNIGQFNKIYAFEPGKKQFKAMKYRVERLINEWALNSEDIECIRGGLGEDNYTVSYCENENSLSSNNLYNIEDKEKLSTIDVYSLDKYLKGKKITFLKADVEGFELQMLKGAKDTIEKYKPKLAMSVYHRPCDLFEIAMYIKGIVPEYKVELRHHSSKLMETVMYFWVD